MLRIDGPAVRDVEDVFASRWNALVARGVPDAEGRTPLPTEVRARAAEIAEAKGSVAVQITTTAPGNAEQSIAETWFNAVRNAERFIYVEDQYFRMPMMHEAIARRMDEKPDLRLVVITRPVSKLDPGCAPTREAQRLFQGRYPDRFLYLTPKAFDPAAGRYDGFVEIFMHAKMLVVDDVFMSVGSANKNNRGLVYELEMNAAVLDRAFVTASRRRMLRALLPDVHDTDDAAAWFDELRAAAAGNQRVFDQNQDVARPVQLPRGFLHPLRVPSSCVFPDVGPDAT
jgi:phosphatidylserine/phosphatidylglycerophosphate/cardiolipin synthase-like enzyme